MLPLFPHCLLLRLRESGSHLIKLRTATTCLPRKVCRGIKIPHFCSQSQGPREPLKPYPQGPRNSVKNFVLLKPNSGGEQPFLGRSVVLAVRSPWGPGRTRTSLNRGGFQGDHGPLLPSLCPVSPKSATGTETPALSARDRTLPSRHAGRSCPEPGQLRFPSLGILELGPSRKAASRGCG